MCVLILLHRVEPDHPVIVAANRDEFLGRRSSPPGIRVGPPRVLCPTDRQAGGTWIGFNEHGLFAGITNRSDLPQHDGRSTRGLVTVQALASRDARAAAAAIERSVTAAPTNGFRLLLADPLEVLLVESDGSACATRALAGPVVKVSNETGPEETVIVGLEELAAPTGGPRPEEGTVGGLLERLRAVLLRDGSDGGHRILKRGERFATVSSSLIAVHTDPARSTFRYAPGRPDLTEYQNYGNLAARLRS